MMTTQDIRLAYLNHKADLSEAFFWLAKNGYCPNLLNDDDGKWAVAFDGFQSVGERDVETHFYVKSERWKSTIREAFIFALDELLVS